MADDDPQPEFVFWNHDDQQGNAVPGPPWLYLSSPDELDALERLAENIDFQATYITELSQRRLQTTEMLARYWADTQIPMHRMLRSELTPDNSVRVLGDGTRARVGLTTILDYVDILTAVDGLLSSAWAAIQALRADQQSILSRSSKRALGLLPVKPVLLHLVYDSDQGEPADLPVNMTTFPGLPRP